MNYDTIIKEIFPKEELKKIAELLGLSQAALYQQTLKKYKLNSIGLAWKNP